MKPRLSYDDFKGQPIHAALIDGSTVYGIVEDLWMHVDGHPLMFRIDGRDYPYQSIVSIRAQPALSDGWHGPNTLAESTAGCLTHSDAHGNTWWHEPERD